MSKINLNLKPFRVERAREREDQLEKCRVEVVRILPARYWNYYTSRCR